VPAHHAAALFPSPITHPPSFPRPSRIRLLSLARPAHAEFRPHFLCVISICAGNYFGALKQWVSLQCDEQVCRLTAALPLLTSVAEQGRSVSFVLYRRPSRHNRQKQRPPPAPAAALVALRGFPDCLRARLQQVYIVCAKSRAAARVAVLAAAVLRPAVLAAPHDAVQV
jgi:hypothetical protein